MSRFSTSLAQIFDYKHTRSSVNSDFVRVCEEPVFNAAPFAGLSLRGGPLAGCLFIDCCGALIRLKHTDLRGYLGVITGLGEGSRGLFFSSPWSHPLKSKMMWSRGKEEAERSRGEI